MISVSDTMIMIVPDSGGSADNEAMVALKNAIEAAGSYTVKVVDLPAIVRAEHDGEELTDAKVIELSARKLEQLASCEGLVWDGTNKVYDHRAESECADYDWGAPKIVVVFGKSAMLAGGLGKKNVLFINPEYDSEWPWTEQYYADGKQAGQYLSDKYDYERGFMVRVLWIGVECSDPWLYSRRYGLITNANHIGEFGDRYPRMAEVNRELDGDTDALAKFICQFADDKLTFPIGEVAEYDYMLPRAGETLKKSEQKRILIVPDYFTPYNAPNVKGLYEQLQGMGYYVAVFVPGETLEDSRQGLERRCKVKPFDLIVAIETGCLLSSRVTNCPRIFINPVWTAWECMRLILGNDRERRENRGHDYDGPCALYYLNSKEVSRARMMADRSYIKRGEKPAFGWFTVDTVESHLPEEHLKRFNTGNYIPGLRLDTDDGIAVLARQIDNILTIDDNE